MKPKFKIGQKVFMGRGDSLRVLTIKKVIDNPMLPVYQYTFEEVGFACGEQSIRKTEHGKDLTISQCIKKEVGNPIKTRVNTMANAMRNIIAPMEEVKLGGELCFKPDFKFVRFIKSLANSRLIVDCGSGQGHLVRMLKSQGARAIGFEPDIDMEAMFNIKMAREDFQDINEVIPKRVENSEEFIKNFGGNAMYIFARPDWDITNALSVIFRHGAEAYLITTEATPLEGFNFEAIPHEGVSEDGEKLFKIKKAL